MSLTVQTVQNVYLVLNVHWVLGPAVYEGKGEVLSHVELLLNGVHHGGRVRGLIPALVRGHDAGPVAVVHGALVK